MMKNKSTKIRIKKGDKVLIIVGKDKGKKGKVEKVISDKGKIVIAGLNVLKKNTKPSQKNRQGGIIEFSAPLNVSNVLLICPKCNKPIRISYKILKGDKGKKSKLRVCQKCNGNI